MAYDFNGSTQYLSCTSSPLGNSPVTFSIACWVNANAGSNRFVAAFGSSTNNTPILTMGAGFADSGQNTSHFRAFSRNDANSIRFDMAGGVAFDNTWHHVCLRCNTTDSKIYVDGANTNTGNAQSGAQTFNRFAIGALLRASALNHIDGSVADVGVWSADLTEQEIKSLSAGMTCDKVRPQSLVFYAPLVRDLQDVRGGLTITNNNTATVANHPRVYA
jgi:hypothetical protein